MFSYLSVLTYVMDAQKNRLNETVLLSTHNICFWEEIRKLALIRHFYLGVWLPNQPYYLWGNKKTQLLLKRAKFYQFVTELKSGMQLQIKLLGKLLNF